MAEQEQEKGTDHILGETPEQRAMRKGLREQEQVPQAQRLTIEFAGDTPIYPHEGGRWVRWEEHAAEVAATKEKTLRDVEEALRKEVEASRQFVIFGTNVRQIQGDPLTEHEMTEGLIVINRGVVTHTLATLKDQSPSVTQKDIDRGVELDDEHGWSDRSHVDEEACEPCHGTGLRRDPHYCNCIMTAHCHGREGKDGARCRLRLFGNGTEGGPGVAGTPQMVCPDCKGTGKKPAQVDEAGSSEGDERFHDDRWPTVAGRWFYRVRYSGGNVDEVRAPGLVEAAQLASERGRVARVEETYEPTTGETPEATEWEVGQILRHPAGSQWELTAHPGGDEDDWEAICRLVGPGGQHLGEPRTFHREYMDRTFTVVAQFPPRCGGTREIPNPGAPAFDSRCPCPGCPDCNPDSSTERGSVGPIGGQLAREVPARIRERVAEKRAEAAYMESVSAPDGIEAWAEEGRQKAKQAKYDFEPDSFHRGRLQGRQETFGRVLMVLKTRAFRVHPDSPTEPKEER